jgi:hypothetical protein
VSNSLADRILVGHSIDRSGHLTRSLHESETSGFLRQDATHWSIEPFLPLSAQTLIEYLISRRELDSHGEQVFRQGCHDLDKIIYEKTADYQTRFTRVYGEVDPDSDRRIPAPVRDRAETVGEQKPLANLNGGQPQTGEAGLNPDSDSDPNSDPNSDPRVDRVLALCDDVLTNGGFRRLATDEISRCVGVVSQFGVPLHVDLEIFKRLVVYARGDVIGSRIRRRLRNFYRREAVEVQVYQRLVVIFQLCDDDQSDEQLTASDLHMRMFKNVPKQDVDTLLPGARVRITGMDRAKIIVPSLGGFLMSLRKIAQYALLFAVITIHWSAILVGLVIGYMVKSVFSYFQTKNRYQLNLTRNLYFQKLDANAGVGYHAIQLAHQQLVAEAILGLYAILSSGEPISTRKACRRCERLVREAIHVEVDFQVDRALESLLKLGVVKEGRSLKFEV